MNTEPPIGSGDDAHPDLERLADLDEGLLEPEQSVQLRAHLAGCTRCRDQHDHLQRTKVLLAELPPETMPAGVLARLDRALSEASGAASSTTIVPLNARRSRWRAHPTAAGLGAAAAVAALVAALVVGHGSSTHRGTSNPTTALGQARAESELGDLTPQASGTNYTLGNLATTVPGLVAGPASGAAGAGAATTSGGAASPHAKSGAAPNSPMSSAMRVAPVPTALNRLYSSPAALRDCVLGVEAGGQTQRPLAIDFASYQGAPAVLIVLPGLSPGNLDAWFVGPGCTSADAHLLSYKAVPASPSPSPSR